MNQASGELALAAFVLGSVSGFIIGHGWRHSWALKLVGVGLLCAGAFLLFCAAFTE